MIALHIRNVNKEVYDHIKELAKEDRRSIQQEVLWLLEKALNVFGKAHRKDWSKLERVQKEMRLRYGILSDSAPLIRQMRNER